METETSWNVFTEEKLDDIVSFLEKEVHENPWTRLIAQSGFSLGLVHTATRLLKSWPCKRAVVKEISNSSSRFRINFYNPLFRYVNGMNVNPEVN